MADDKATGGSLVLSLWKEAEIAIDEAIDQPVRKWAKDVVVAILRRLAVEVELAEKNDNEFWPDSGDLLILAGEVEECDDPEAQRV